MRGFVLILLFLITGCATSQTYQSISASPSFHWPVKKGKLTQKFKSGSRKHQGIDIGAWNNASIYAAEDGLVIYAGRDFTGYGNLIIIEHGNDTWASFYAHLNSFKVREGSRVQKGELIGLMGKTGRATGVHLHFEIRYKRTPIDPLLYLPQQVFLTKR